MKTVVLGPQPAELRTLIQRRQALGIDRFDEVWEGDYHVTPGPSAAHAYLDAELVGILRPYALAAGLVGTTGFNLGEPNDYRVPDGGYHRGRPTGTWVPTAAIVVEVVSPDDETYDKFGFYAAHGVDELIVADPARRAIGIWQRVSADRYERAEASSLLQVSAADLAAAVDWPD